MPPRPFVAAERIRTLAPYAFAEVGRRVAELRSKGITPIDFGVGDPKAPTPPFIRQALKEAADRHAATGYPSYIGSREFRTAICGWMQRRFGIGLDPETEIASSIGSKEAIFHAPLGFVDPGDVVIMPSPGYPPYTRGTTFVGGVPYYLPLVRENGFLPEPEVVPEDVARRARMLWLNYPHAPSGALASRAYLARWIAWAKERGIIVCSDEAYSEIWFGEGPPPSALEIAREGVLAFFSLSKRSAMTGYRVGWVAGDRRLIEVFRKVKTNVDSGTPNFVQDAAAAALADEEHVRAFRADYRRKRDLLAEALVRSGLEDCRAEGTLYLWQRTPPGVSSADFAGRLLAPEVAVVTTPGAWIAEPLADGRNPGEGYVRFALVPTPEDTAEAARRLAALRW